MKLDTGGFYVNKKVIAIVILTIVALCYLTVYTFLPSLIRSSGSQVNPQSSKPTSTTGQNNETLVYHNQDLTENFYTVNVPKSWQLQSTSLGEYIFGFNGGTATTELLDVPDNSTLELLILSQDEPKLATTIKGYEKISYQKLSINGNYAYQIYYFSDANGVKYENIKTYITGQDHASVITFSAQQAMFGSLNDTFTTVLRSFSWG